MAFGDYLIEVGKQIMIGEAGTTFTSESKLHLRTFSADEIKSYFTRSVSVVDQLNSRLQRVENTDEKVGLLSEQLAEITKMMMLLMSQGLGNIK